MLNISASIASLAFLESIVFIRNLASCPLAPFELLSACPLPARFGLYMLCYILINDNSNAVTYNCRALLYR